MSIFNVFMAAVMFIITITLLQKGCQSDSGLRALAQRGYGARVGQTYLSVGHADEALVDQLVRFGVPRLAFHDVALGCLVSQ